MSSCFLRTIWAKMIIPSNNTFWQQQGAGDSLLEFSRGYKLVQSLCKTICHYLVTLRAKALTVPALPLSGAHSGESPSSGDTKESYQSRGACHSRTLEMYTRSRLCKHSLAEPHSSILFSQEQVPTITRVSLSKEAGMLEAHPSKPEPPHTCQETSLPRTPLT